MEIKMTLGFCISDSDNGNDTDSLYGSCTNDNDLLYDLGTHGSC